MLTTCYPPRIIYHMVDDFDDAGTELYRERFVRAMAHDLQVPLLVLDSSVLAPYVSLF